MEESTKELAGLDRPLIKNCRRNVVLAFFAFAVLALTCVALLSLGSGAQAHTLSVRILHAGKVGVDGSAELIVVISNASKTIVLCDNGPPLFVAYLENDSWKTNYTGGSVTGAMFLQPGRVEPPISIGKFVPRNTEVKAVRVGLSIVPFSWRGKLGLNISRFKLLKPLAGLLFRFDESKRSMVEWSDPFITK